MKLEMTDKEAMDLLDLIYIGKYITDSHDDTKLIKKYESLCGKVLNQYFQQGIKDGIDKNDKMPYPFFTAKYDEKMDEVIECHDSRTFYSALIAQISKNQLVDKLGTEAYETMDNEEFENQFEAMRQKIYQKVRLLPA